MASWCLHAWAQVSRAGPKPHGVIPGGGAGLQLSAVPRVLLVKKMKRRVVSTLTRPFGECSLIGKVVIYRERKVIFLQAGVLCPFHPIPEQKNPFLSFSFFFKAIAFSSPLPRPLYVFQAPAALLSSAFFEYFHSWGHLDLRRLEP